MGSCTGQESRACRGAWNLKDLNGWTHQPLCIKYSEEGQLHDQSHESQWMRPVEWGNLGADGAGDLHLHLWLQCTLLLRDSVRGSPAAGAHPPPGPSPSSSITNLPVPFWFLSSSQPQTMGATHTPCAASALLAAPPVLTHLLDCCVSWSLEKVSFSKVREAKK